MARFPGSRGVVPLREFFQLHRWSFYMNKQIVRSGALVSGLGVSGLALADSTAATAAITAAQTDGIAIAAALTSMAVAIWGALYIKRKFFG